MILEHLNILKDYIQNYSVDAFEQIGNKIKETLEKNIYQTNKVLK